MEMRVHMGRLRVKVSKSMLGWVGVLVLRALGIKKLWDFLDTRGCLGRNFADFFLFFFFFFNWAGNSSFARDFKTARRGFMGDGVRIRNRIC